MSEQLWDGGSAGRTVFPVLEIAPGQPSSPMVRVAETTKMILMTRRQHTKISKWLASDEYDGLEPLDLLADWQGRRPRLLARVRAWICRALVSRHRLR